MTTGLNIIFFHILYLSDLVNTLPVWKLHKLFLDSTLLSSLLAFFFFNTVFLSTFSKEYLSLIKSHIALVEDLSSVPSTCIRWLIRRLTPAPRCPLWFFSGTYTHMHIPTQRHITYLKQIFTSIH